MAAGANKNKILKGEILKWRKHDNYNVMLIKEVEQAVAHCASIICL